MTTAIHISPRQFVQTVAGNVALKISHHVGYHAAHFGRRSHDFYLDLTDATVAMCRQNSAPFSKKPEFLNGADTSTLQMDAMMAVSEIVTTTKTRIKNDLDGYLTEAATFWNNSQAFAHYRHSADGMPSDEVVDIILDSSDGEYVSRIDPKSLHIAEERFSLPASDRYFKESGTKLVYETLAADPSIKTVINIGSRIDPTLYFCAKRFPERKFLGFDFQHNLRNQNEAAFGALPDNLFFASGYAIEALDRGLRADAVFFMATSVLFTVKEMERYLALFARNGFKTVIISESWASPIEGYDCGLIVRPEDVDINKPFLGGTVLNAQHNYIAHLENANYRVDSSAIIDDHFGGWYNILQIVATL